jgi:hypothetical protein
MEELKDLVAAALALQFEERESSYRCGRYWLAHEDWHEKAFIQHNCMEDNDEPFEPDFPDHRVLLYVEAELDEAPLQSIPGLELLHTIDG